MLYYLAIWILAFVTGFIVGAAEEDRQCTYLNTKSYTSCRSRRKKE